MFKKILGASIAFSLCLSANNVSIENIDCDKEFEDCVLVCNKTASEDSDPMCIEKCEMLYDKCILLLENQNNSNDEIITPVPTEEVDSKDEYIQSEIESNTNLEENLEKIELELNKKQEDN